MKDFNDTNETFESVVENPETNTNILVEGENVSPRRPKFKLLRLPIAEPVRPPVLTEGVMYGWAKDKLNPNGYEVKRQVLKNQTVVIWIKVSRKRYGVSWLQLTGYFENGEFLFTDTSGGRERMSFGRNLRLGTYSGIEGTFWMEIEWSYRNLNDL